MKRWIFSLISFMTITSWATIQSVDFPKYKGWVNDFARIIPSRYEERMAALAGEVKQKTGVEMAVVSVEDMGGLEIEEYAVRLYETWGIGERDKDNGILLLLTMAERKARIEVGYGLEGIIPDGLAGEILDDHVIPDFREGNYGRGFLCLAQ